MKKVVLSVLLLVTACGPPPANDPTATLAVVKVYATPAAQPWLEALYNCAARQSTTLSLSGPASAEIALRVGEPQDLRLPAFQLAWEEIVVIVNPAHTFRSLQTEQVVGLFTGAINDWSQVSPNETGAVRVWVFAAGDDAQQVFAKTLTGSVIVSNARLATSPEEMSRAVASDPNAVGILSGHWNTGNVSNVYVAASAPVLAVTPAKPQGVTKDLLACLQG